MLSNLLNTTEGRNVVPSRKVCDPTFDGKNLHTSILRESGHGPLYLGPTNCSGLEAPDGPSQEDRYCSYLHDWITVSVISCHLPLCLEGLPGTTQPSACLASILSIYYRVQLEKTSDQSWGVINANTTTCLSPTTPPARTLQETILRADQDSSLLEMFVGIICACMPAASNTYHHHLPSYQSWNKKLRFRYGTYRLRNGSTSPSSQNRFFHNVKTFRSVHEECESLTASELPLPPPARFLKDRSRSGSSDDLGHVGNLTYELQQTFTSPLPHTRRWTIA